METLADLLPLSPDLRRERLAELRRLFPDLFTDEGRLNPEELQRLAEADGATPAGAAERYEFRWHGKARSKREAFSPSRAALVHDAGRSLHPERAAGNVIIEGENLEVLKLLASAYRGRVKCIYIDPPYNTGKDFVYSDDYSADRRPYWEQTGVTDDVGVKVDTLTESHGRYHSDWLSMMHPRMLVARKLLKPEGVILVSIDDHEYDNLKRLMDEVFGPENYIATLVWEKGRKNDARYFSVGHEYVLVYGRDLVALKELGTVWREPKPGATEIWEKYLELKSDHGDDFPAIEAGLSAWFTSLPEKNPSKKLGRYRRVDKYGPWRDRDISWPGGGGPRYEVLHPRTRQPCAVPERGWGFSKPEEMQRQIALGLVVFREDHTQPPFRKAHLKPIPEELVSNGDEENDEDNEAEEVEMATQVRGSYFYAQSQSEVKYLRALMGGKVFPNPKDHQQIARLIDYVTNGGDDDIILDFFGGSGTTAEAVMQLNGKSKTHKKFILVQLPAQVGPKDPAYELNFRKISDITIKRIQLVIEKLQADAASLLPGDPRRTFADSLGFKVYRLTRSAFPRVEFAPDPALDEAANVARLRDYIREKEATFDLQLDADAALDEILLKQGLALDATVSPQPDFPANRVLLARDGAGRELLLCLDPSLQPETVAAFRGRAHRPFLCLDRALDTTRKWNLQQHLGAQLKTL